MALLRDVEMPTDILYTVEVSMNVEKAHVRLQCVPLPSREADEVSMNLNIRALLPAESDAFDAVLTCFQSACATVERHVR